MRCQGRPSLIAVPPTGIVIQERPTLADGRRVREGVGIVRLLAERPIDAREILLQEHAHNAPVDDLLVVEAHALAGKPFLDVLGVNPDREAPVGVGGLRAVAGGHTHLHGVRERQARAEPEGIVDPALVNQSLNVPAVQPDSNRVPLDSQFHVCLQMSRGASRGMGQESHESIRPESEYTLKRPSRTKPSSVIPHSRASSTARLDGAPTAPRTGTPAIAAFCTSSKLTRPLTSTRRSARGIRPARSSTPISLSRALWRPTSSRRQSSRPDASKRPEAWMPPVRAKPD